FVLVGAVGAWTWGSQRDHPVLAALDDARHRRGAHDPAVLAEDAGEGQPERRLPDRDLDGAERVAVDAARRGVGAEGNLVRRARERTARRREARRPGGDAGS